MTYKLNENCTCKPKQQQPIRINFDRMDGFGDVVCKKCKKYIRLWDSG